MKLRWTASAERDLVRLHAFLVTINAHAAAQVVRQLVAGAEQLMQYPQLGVRLEEFLPRDVRRIIMGDYEMRYELTDEIIYILRLWHGREDR
ncbi:MAG: type II toxin-antitoxin system RelE/ParE family toxin [Burkholderiales bacterium]|nr:type II toxin-antitoxin system RelE/ParE family toxin [Burkholderiales bacterium]MCP5291244.1 type II toxin-antitoxin system RelE/ParE family toxin [Burkholderiales bacterium]HQU62841.1 type II toxin-antitoxin system RelE/ParE family toxin [Nitrosomonas sp.]